MAMPVNHRCSDVHGQAVVSTIAEKTVDRMICALDFDTLECSVCCQLLAPPVYQCQNGHTACANCCKSLMGGLCPSCSLPIGANRCIVVEKIIESLRVNCKHADRGCKKMVPYTKGKRDDHEDFCALRPYQCPVGGCKFETQDAYFLRHFEGVHNGARLLELWPDDDMKGFFTTETGDGEYYQPLTQFVMVHVFKCDDSEDRDDKDQIAKGGGSGESTIRMFLVHHRFHNNVNMHSFSCTSFGVSNTLTQYRLSVDVVNNGRFKVNHNISGPILDNQEDNSTLDNVVQRGDCLLVPVCKGISFEVEFLLF